MPALRVLYKRPTLSAALVGFIGWMTVLLGWVAAILFAAWIAAAVAYAPALSDWLFYGFSLACAAALGLREIRWHARTLPFVFVPPLRR